MRQNTPERFVNLPLPSDPTFGISPVQTWTLRIHGFHGPPGSDVPVNLRIHGFTVFSRNYHGYVTVHRAAKYP
eukprot:4210929-Alexandrium_andersonii.AAC.1